MEVTRIKLPLIVRAFSFDRAVSLHYYLVCTSLADFYLGAQLTYQYAIMPPVKTNWVF